MAAVPELYTHVLINRDIPDQGLHQGDVGLYIEYLEHPDGGEDGAIVEIATLNNEMRLVTIPVDAIESPSVDLVWTARKTDLRWFKDKQVSG